MVTRCEEITEKGIKKLEEDLEEIPSLEHLEVKSDAE